jgi:uncharacterized protein (TIGR02246 family)
VSANTPEEVHKLFLDAFNRADVEALVALYEPDAVLVTGSGTAVGREQIREAYKPMLESGGRMELKTCGVLDNRNGLAVLHASWTYHRDGNQVAGLSTEVVRRQAEGIWLFALDEPYTPGAADM